MKKLLEMTPPKGKDFLRKIDHILEREKNWVRNFSVHPSFSLSLKTFFGNCYVCSVS